MVRGGQKTILNLKRGDCVSGAVVGAGHVFNPRNYPMRVRFRLEETELGKSYNDGSPMRGKWWSLSRTRGAQGLSPEPVSLATELYCLENGESK